MSDCNDGGALYTAIPNAVLQSLCNLKATPCACLTLLNLYRRAGENGICWPSLSTISGDTGFSKQSVCSAVDWLRENGFILTEKRSSEKTGHTSTVYQVLPLVKSALLPLSSQLDYPLSSQLEHKKYQLEEKPEKNSIVASEEWKRFRAMYPKRRGNLNAAKAQPKFEQYAKSVGYDQIFAALHESLRIWRVDKRIGTEFIPMMTTWLNQQPWNEMSFSEDRSGVLDTGGVSEVGGADKTSVRSQEACLTGISGGTEWRG